VTQICITLGCHFITVNCLIWCVLLIKYGTEYVTRQNDLFDYCVTQHKPLDLTDKTENHGENLCDS